MVLGKFCRLCLRESAEETLIDLYRENTTALTRTGTILKQHFWFDFEVNEPDFLSKVICPKCWSNVENFDDFFNFVKETHQQHYAEKCHCSSTKDERLVIRYLNEVTKDEIKEEPSDLATIDEVIAIPFNVLENSNCSDNDDGNKCEDDPIYSSESEENYKPPPKKKIKSLNCKKSPKLTRKKSSKIETDAESESELIRKYFKMECDKCSEKFVTFTSATMHYQQEHDVEKGYLSCSKCDNKFTNKSYIKQHCKWHDNAESNKCTICNRNFVNSCALKKHLNIHEKKGVVKFVPRKARKMNSIEKIEMVQQRFKMECDICSAVFETFKAVKNHFKEAHNRNGYLLCCDKKFFRISQAFDHCQWHENPDYFKCEVCQKLFMDSLSLMEHGTNMHTPEDERLFKCDACQRTFAKEYMLVKHMRTHMKNDTDIFECHICGKKLATKHILQCHIDNVHENKHAQVCDICAKSFKTYKYYQMHYLSEHTNINRKVQCDLCGTWLKHKEGLKIHMRRHADPPVNCKICGLTSKNKSTLKVHMKTIHRPATYRCTICDRMFKVPKSLKEHMAIHTGVTDLYKCPFCSKTFRSGANMYKHRRIQHPVEYAQYKASRTGDGVDTMSTPADESAVAVIPNDMNYE